MKKLLLLVIAVTLFAGLSFAGGRETKDNREGVTHFPNVEATGLDNTGNPGVIQFVAPDHGGANFTYYLWVNGGGKLCLASNPTISAYSSFPTGNWNNQAPGMGCTIVGSQS